MVTDAVIEQVDSVQGTDLGSYALKDISEPVSIWRLAGDPAPPNAVPARRTNVQESRTTYVDQRGAVEELAARVAENRLVTITGPGGLGKTRLAVEYALAHWSTTPGGVWLLELAAVESTEELHRVFAAALGLSSTTSADEVCAEINRRDKAMVVVVDNCEHVLDAAAELVALVLSSCADARVLCTSREPLLVDGEHVMRLAPLQTSTDNMHGEAAEALFLERARRSAAELDETSIAEITAICKYVDGIPLAIELAAAQCFQMPVADILLSLEAGTADLKRRGSSARQSTLEALVAWSLRLLEPAQLRGLLRLSLFPGSMSRDIALDLIAEPDALTVLESLVHASLVDEDGEQVRLLYTIHAVCRRRLDGDPTTLASAETALVGWGQRFAEAHYRDFLVTDWPLDTHAGLRLAFAIGYDNDNRPLGPLMHCSNVLTSTWQSAVPRLEEICDEILAGPDPTDADGVIMHRIALYRIRTYGAWTQPVERYERITELARRYGDPWIVSLCLCSLALRVAQEARELEAIGYLTEATEISLAADDVYTLHLAYASLAKCYEMCGQPDKAAEISLLSAETGKRYQGYYAPADLANTIEYFLDSGDCERAEEILDLAARSPLDTFFQTVMMALRAETLLRLGRTDDGLDLARHVRLEAERLKDQYVALPIMLGRLNRATADR